MLTCYRAVVRANSTHIFRIRRLAPGWDRRPTTARSRAPRPPSPAHSFPEIGFVPHPPRNWVRSVNLLARQSTSFTPFFSSSSRPDRNSSYVPQAICYRPPNPKIGFVSYSLSRFLRSPGPHSSKLGSFRQFLPNLSPPETVRFVNVPPARPGSSFRQRPPSPSGEFVSSTFTPARPGSSFRQPSPQPVPGGVPSISPNHPITVPYFN
jgi:hypothetical protein